MVTVLCGSNEFMLKVELKKLTAEFIQQNDDLALEKFDGESAELNTVLDAVQSVPFLSTNKMVIIKSLGKQLSENINKIIDQTADTTSLIIFEPHIDKRTSYYKTLKNQKNFFELTELDERSLANWAVNYAKEQGAELSYDTAVFLISRVGANQLNLSNEIKKLSQYNLLISRDSVELLTDQIPQSKIFDLIDSAFNGNYKKALKIYDEQRTQKVEPVQIIGMITWQLNAIAVVKYAGDRSIQQIAKDSSINPYALEKSKKLASKMTAGKLKAMIKGLSEIDVLSKTTQIDVDQALKLYIMSLE